jgi:hypothetical protein
LSKMDRDRQYPIPEMAVNESEQSRGNVRLRILPNAHAGRCVVKWVEDRTFVGESGSGHTHAGARTQVCVAVSRCLICAQNSLLASKNSLFRCVGNLAVTL